MKKLENGIRFTKMDERWKNKEWNIYDLNPDDLIKIEYDGMSKDLFKDMNGKTVPILYVKANDSFPGVKVACTKKYDGPLKTVDGKPINPDEHDYQFDYVFEPQQFKLVKKLPRNNKRWTWIYSGIGLDKDYKPPIRRNLKNRFNWQTWGDDGYYHCPFCDKQLEEVDIAEKRDASEEVIKSCDCEMWLKRELAFEEWRETQDLADRMKEKIFGDSQFSLPSV